jgi:D-alanyl-D-alanine carboxypeptidase/D-alanyl-D-alanine-endopeptidase (penicillin-binding protein 4)
MYGGRPIPVPPPISPGYPPVDGGYPQPEPAYYPGPPADNGYYPGYQPPESGYPPSEPGYPPPLYQPAEPAYPPPPAYQPPPAYPPSAYSPPIPGRGAPAEPYRNPFNQPDEFNDAFFAGGSERRAKVIEAKAKKSRGLAWFGLIVTLLVLALAGGGIYKFRPGPFEKWLGGTDESFATLPADPAASPVLAGLNSAAPAPTPAGITKVIKPMMSQPGLGYHATASVVDVTTGQVLFADGPDTLNTPASTTKLFTGAAVLATRGPAYRLETRVVAGANPGEVVIIGGGDPTLSVNGNGSYADAARLDKLASQVKAALGGQAPTKVVYDSSLFSGPTNYAGWLRQDLIDGYIANITPLMLDGARIDPKDVKDPSPRQDQPDRAAAQQFAKLLGLPSSAVAKGAAPEGAQQLGIVSSPPVARLVEMMLTESDNVVAEMLARQVALAANKPADFTNSVAAIKAQISQYGLDAAQDKQVDGSGLADANQITTSLEASLLALSTKPDRPELSILLSGLPVAGYSGTLKDRYKDPDAGKAAAGLVRAKTGSLDHAAALTGLVVTKDGRLLVFALLADQLTNGIEPAKAAQDRIAAALAACGCN